MDSQICFFEKNFLDLDYEDATITATQGDEFSTFVRNRNLNSAWMTTGSVDADNPVIEWDLMSPFLIDRIILLDHNFKSYFIETYDPDTAVWTEIYDATADTKESTELSFSEFYGQRMRLTIRGTQVADEDKRLNRLIVTKKLGQFSHWPKIENPVIDQGKSARTALSGKKAILKTVGAYSCRLSIDNWRNEADLALIELLYRQVEGFQMWIGGGQEAQFFYAAESYRDKDFYLVGFANDFKPKLNSGIYVNGYDLTLDLVEVVR